MATTVRSGKRKLPDGRINYTLHAVQFRVVREANQPDARVLTGPAETERFIREIELLPDDAREHFGAIYLDAQNQIVATHEVSVGTLATSLVHPREVFGPALRIMGVASVLLAHNHPSGDPTPSREDIRLTRALCEAARLLDLRIHDHVILGDGSGRYVSLAEMGLIS